MVSVILDQQSSHERIVALILHWMGGGGGGGRGTFLIAWQRQVSVPLTAYELLTSGEVLLQSDQSGRAQWGPVRRRKELGELRKGRRGCSFAKMIMC